MRGDEFYQPVAFESLVMTKNYPLCQQNLMVEVKTLIIEQDCAPADKYAHI